MLPTVITVCVVIICLCTASYLLIRIVRWIARLVRPRDDEDHPSEGPPDLFQGF